MSDEQPEPSQNPFAAPNPSKPSPPQYDGSHYGQPGRGYINQIPILAAMTIVQGVLLTMMGMFCVGYGLLFSLMPSMMPPDERARMKAEAGQFFEIASWSLIGIGTLVFIIAIMHFVAGIRSLNYRGRAFTITTWALGLLASITVYCAPTSFGLAIWGLIVFLNPAVANAFKMAEEGMNKKDIPNQFY